MKSGFKTNVTVISNNFIDDYMAAANGEYVKVYLYLLRHQDVPVTVEVLADALNHTEADVRRALAYWKKAGVLLEETENEKTEKPVESAEHREAQVTGTVKEESSATVSPVPAAEKKPAGPRPSYTPDQVNRLAKEEEFTQLLYIAQKYMNKIFTPRECEVFAYLYDGLHMPAELLEYLVEYCVQGGHSSIRYIETVALNWYEKGLLTVQQAKGYTVSYTKDTFAVMKAFGLNDRKPGEAETETIRRWFKEYGFDREIIVEACNRTLASIHSPSFQYADKILSQWKKAGVRNRGDIKALDEKREQKQPAKQPTAPKTGKNQFHNFEQRDTNYDAMVLERLKERLGEQ